jgi:hypothetical protein
MLTERGGARGRDRTTSICSYRGAGARDREPGVLVIGACAASPDTTGAALIEITSIRAPTLVPTMRGVG